MLSVIFNILIEIIQLLFVSLLSRESLLFVLLGLRGLLVEAFDYTAFLGNDVAELGLIGLGLAVVEEVVGEVGDGELGVGVIEQGEAVGKDLRELFAFEEGYAGVFGDVFRFHF